MERSHPHDDEGLVVSAPIASAQVQPPSSPGRRGRRRTDSRRIVLQAIAGVIGIAGLSMTFIPIASNVFRTGASATYGLIAVAVSVVIGALLALANGQGRYIVGWVLVTTAIVLSTVLVTAIFATLS